MLVKKSNAREVKNSKNCTVWEYKFPSKLLSFATVFINGRYPQKGRVANLGCYEIYYVLSGSGAIHSEKGDFKISEGDLYFFGKGEKYWTEGRKLFLVLINAPKWSPGQYRVVD